MSFLYWKRGDQDIPSCPIEGKQRAAKSHECHAKPSEHRGATLLGTIMRQRGYTEAWLRPVKLAIRQQPYCSVPGCTNTDLTGDHRVPLSRGGTSTLENVQVFAGGTIPRSVIQKKEVLARAACAWLITQNVPS